MKKIELIRREILEKSPANNTFEQMKLAEKFHFSTSTVHAAIKPLRSIGAVSVTGRNFRVTDWEKILMFWATRRNLAKDILFRTHVDLPVMEIEGLIDNDTIDAVTKETFIVPRLEKLLILKQLAHIQRGLSAKGQKDRIDILSLVLSPDFDPGFYRKELTKTGRTDLLFDLKKLIAQTVKIPEIGINEHFWSRAKKKIPKSSFQGADRHAGMKIFTKHSLLAERTVFGSVIIKSMGKGSSTIWECQNCGAQFPKWTGQCPECQKWNSLVETVVFIDRAKGQGLRAKGKEEIKPQKLSDILKYIDASGQRTGTGIEELDRVLGGGLVSGEVVLLAGEPGMGKSTLLSRVALAVDSPVLYVCGEESPGQVALRLQRLVGSRLAVNDSRLTLLAETNVDAVVAEIETQFSYRPSVVGFQSQVNQFSVSRSKTAKLKTGGPETENRQLKTDNRIVIVDSIQTLTTDDLTGVAGSVGQVRESAGRLMEVAKKLNVPIFLVGHVTKDGTVAGPKVLEHMVDAVLVLEGERSGNFRILRAVKNRFGAVDEVGLFAMDNGDMKEVVNPGELLVGGAAGKVSGSVLGCALEGLRPLILEVQALAVPSKLAVPRRVGQGISERKLQVLCAVVERYVNRKLGEMDIFVNIAGGLKSNDPGLDLAAVGAVISAMRDPSTPRRLVAQDDRKPVIFCGEVGLLGEIRQVQGWERRKKEVARLGLGKLVGKPTIGHILELLKV